MSRVPDFFLPEPLSDPLDQVPQLVCRIPATHRQVPVVGAVLQAHHVDGLAAQLLIVLNVTHQVFSQVPVVLSQERPRAIQRLIALPGGRGSPETTA